MSSTDHQRIIERYPVRKRPWLVPVIAAPLLALLVFWLWISAFHSNPALTANVAGFEVLSDAEIKVKVTIDRARPEVTGHCLVFAQAPNYERVGELVLPVAASEHKVETVEVTVRTFRRATAASVNKCAAD